MVGGDTQALWLWYWLPPISSLKAVSAERHGDPRNDHEVQGRDFRATHFFVLAADSGESGVVERGRPTGGPVDLPNAKPLPQILSWLTDITAGCEVPRDAGINVSSFGGLAHCIKPSLFSVQVMQGSGLPSVPTAQPWLSWSGTV
jgi:hypothetical protein